MEDDLLFTFQEHLDWKDKKEPFGSSALENMYFQVPWTWSTLFQASGYLAIASFSVFLGIQRLTGIDGSYPNQFKHA